MSLALSRPRHLLPQILDSDNVFFKYPEYVQFDQDTSALDKLVSVLVWFPHRDEKLGVRSVSVVGQLEEPVQALLDSVLKKHKLTTGTTVTAVESGVFVFKVVGYAEYLLHMDFRLADYDFIREAMRKQLKIELELVELSVIDAADLAGTLGMSRSAAVEAELQKARPHGDDWLESEMALRKAGGVEDIIDFADIHWPLRVSDLGGQLERREGHAKLCVCFDHAGAGSWCRAMPTSALCREDPSGNENML